MPSQIAGNLVLDQHQIFKAADGTPLSGVTYPSNPGISILLTRQSGSTMVVASETVAWTEIGTTGTYFFSFTPTLTGLYVLTITSLLTGSGAGSDGAIVPFRYEVLAAGAVNTPSYQNAYCAESDVERYLLQPIDSTTKPNDTQVASFAVGRSARLTSLMQGLGKTTSPADTALAGTTLLSILREAAAVGAALDASVAQVFSTGKDLTTKIVSLIAAWTSYVGEYKGSVWVQGAIGQEIEHNAVSLTSSHILSGDTQARVSDSGTQDIGIAGGGGITMGQVF